MYSAGSGFENLSHHLVSRLLALLLGYSRDMISRLLTPDACCLASPPRWTLALSYNKLFYKLLWSLCSITATKEELIQEAEGFVLSLCFLKHSLCLQHSLSPLVSQIKWQTLNSHDSDFVLTLAPILGSPLLF